MKRALLIVFLIPVLAVQAQETGNFFHRLTSDAILLTASGLVQEDGQAKEFLSEWEDSHDSGDYSPIFSKNVNASLKYEIGMMETQSGIFSFMTIQSGSDSEIEFLVMYKQSGAKEPSAINQARNDWMALCNAHNAAKLVQQLYTPNAYYYNRGRLIEGTAAISQEYQYMNNANYSLKLTPLHVELVSANIAFEIGQCSGSYPLPYMLLWEKQSDGNWQVLMDSNF